MPQCLIGKVAPHFKAKAVLEGKYISDLDLSSLLGKYVVLFFILSILPLYALQNCTFFKMPLISFLKEMLR